MLEITCFKEGEPSLQKVQDRVHLAHAILDGVLLFGKAVLQEILDISDELLLSL